MDTEEGKKAHKLVSALFLHHEIFTQVILGRKGRRTKFLLVLALWFSLKSTDSLKINIFECSCFMARSVQIHWYVKIFLTI